MKRIPAVSGVHLPAGARILRACRATGSALFLTAVLRLPAAGAQAENVTVTADSVNLRAGPGEEYEVVAQVSRTGVLTRAGATEGDWQPVDAPAGADLFVYAELVDGDRSAVDGLQVRAGPGINYTPVGQLVKGAPLTIRSRQGDWLRISPPAGSRLWIHTMFLHDAAAASRDSAEAGVVEPAPATVAAPVVVPAVRPWAAPAQPREAEVRTARAAPNTMPETASAAPTWAPVATTARPSTPGRNPPPVIEGEGVRTVRSQDRDGIPVRYIGVLRPAGMVLRRPSQYRLVYRDALGRTMTRCYVDGEEQWLASKAGARVELTGREVSVPGVRYPLVHAESIREY